MANTRRNGQADSYKNGRKCPYCFKDFFKADHFNRHLRSHTKEKPFSCKDCGKSYPRHDTMLRHIRTNHKDQNQRITTTNTNISDPDSVGARPTPVLTSWMENTSPVPSQQQQPSFSQGQTGFDMEVSYHTYAHGHNINFPQDANFSPATSLGQPQPTFQSVAPSLESAPAASGQHEAQPPFFIHEFDAFHDEADPMSWLLQDDYNLNNFNHLLFGGDNSQVDSSQVNIGNPRVVLPPESNQNRPLAEHSRRRVPDLQYCWYTQGSATEHGLGSRSISPAPCDEQSKDDIDESYRVNAALRLRHESRNEPLPPIGVLNLFIHLFFIRFNAVLPLIHGPTFQPTKENALLTLTICSAGSLWLGSREAANTGSMLFERVNKAILESPWERRLLENQSDGVNTMKASVIGQTFGILSGNPVHLETAGVYHGTVLSAARRMRFFRETAELTLQDNPSASQLYQIWRSWARSEERKRMAVCIYIHDAELAGLFHHEPFLRHNSGHLPKLCSTELFNAPTAEAWYARWKIEREQGTTVTPCSLESHSILAGIGASIAAERRLNTLTTESIAHYEAELLAWYGKALEIPHNGSLPENGTSQLTPNVLALWHFAWITLYVDLNILEVAIGREGSNIPQSTDDYVNSWVRSNRSLRCLLHAWLVQDYMARMPAGQVVSIHIPRILFSAAVVWHCYISYQPRTLPAISRPLKLDSIQLVYIRSLPEVQIMTQERQKLPVHAGAQIGKTGLRPINDNIARFQETLGSVLTQIKQQTLYTLAAILRHSICYGIATKMADIIEMCLYHGVDVIEDNS